MLRPRLRPGVTLKVLGDESILFDPASRTAHIINRVAAEVCELCDGSHTPGEVARALAERYADAAPSIPGDVTDFLSELESHGLLGDASQPGGGSEATGGCKG